MFNKYFASFNIVRHQLVGKVYVTDFPIVKVYVTDLTHCLDSTATPNVWNLLPGKHEAFLNCTSHIINFAGYVDYFQ
jgi:hypothetical protein